MADRDREQLEIEKVYANERILDDPWQENDQSTSMDMEASRENEEKNEKQFGQTKADFDDLEDDEDDYRAPIMDSRNITFKTKILNSFLICSLCKGYFKDAYTIIECLHTFCKSCIYKAFMQTSDCPQCGVHLGPSAFEKIKYDRQLQTFIDKVFPHLEKKDSEEERKMLGLPMEQETKREEPEVQVPTKKLKKSDVMKKFYSDEVGFELNLHELEKDRRLKPLEKPFIRTSAKVTIKHLKKYLQKKLSLPDSQELELTYKNEALGNEHTLEFIFKTKGIDHQDGHPHFKYRVRRAEFTQLV